MERKISPMSALVLAGAMAAGCAGVETKPDLQNDMYAAPSLADQLSGPRRAARRQALKTLNAQYEGLQADGSIVRCITAAEESVDAIAGAAMRSVEGIFESRYDPSRFRTPGFPDLAPEVKLGKVDIGGVAKTDPFDGTYTVCVKANPAKDAPAKY